MKILRAARRAAAEAAYQQFVNQAIELDIVDSDGWEITGNKMVCPFYIANETKPEAPSIKCHFTVIFAPKTSDVIDTDSTIGSAEGEP
jgi:hypothetical protein